MQKQNDWKCPIHFVKIPRQKLKGGDGGVTMLYIKSIFAIRKGMYIHVHLSWDDLYLK